VKAFAVYEGLDDSEIAEATYTLWTPTTLQSISEATTWDWTSWSETITLDDTTTPSKNDEVVYSDFYTLGLCKTDFGNTMAFTGQYPVNSKRSQAGTWHFNTKVAGTIEVTFSDTGSSGTGTNRYLVVNGEETEYYTCRDGSSADQKTSGAISVAAGDVTITGSKAIRVYKIVFTPAESSDTRTITAAKEYTTHCDTVALDFSGITDAKPYYVSAADTTAGTVTLSKFDGDLVPAGEGYILWNQSTSETSFEVPVYDGEPDFSGENLLTGADYEDATIDETSLQYYNVYILKDGVFVPSATGTFPKGHAFLVLPKSSSDAKFSIVFDDGTNGINEVKTAANNGKIYNLQGIEVKDASNGIFIINGKKVIK